MASSDGSVDIRVTGSVDPSVAAAANEATASIGSIGTSAAGLRPGFDASAASLKLLIAQTGSFAAAQKALGAANGDMAAALLATKVAEEGATGATTANTVATEVNAHAALNSRSVYEGLALVHEAMAGRYTRMASTSLIFGQALAGQSAVTKAAAFATSGYGAAILGTVAAIGLVIAATISAESEEKKLTETAIGLGSQSGLTAEQLKKIGESADTSSQSIRETTKAAEAFATAGLRDEQTVKQLSTSVEAYSQLIGGKFADAEKTLAAAMKDPVKGAKELHDQLGILNADQLQQIQRLVDLGDKDQAVAIITQALKERLDEAHTAGVGLGSGFNDLINVLSNAYNWIGQVTEGFGREAETILEDLIPALHQAAQAHRDEAAAARDQAQSESELNKISARGREAFNATPEGQAAARRAELQGNLNAAKDALKVDEALVAQGKERADVLVRDREAIEDYTHATRTYVTDVEKKTKIDAIDVKIAEARHSHNKQLVADLTEQKALLQEAGKIESDADAKALAAGKGDVAGAKTFAPKGAKGPSIVAEWTEQLHEAEIASGEFFKDQTADELAFWENKVGQVKKGSKEWLAVQEKVYEAQKSLAHKDYDEHIADLNDRIEADHDDFKKFQADWEQKLAFIKAKHGEESTEYKDAHRQFEAEERQHQDQMIREELSGNSRAIQALKQHLAAMRQVRQTEASAAEAIVKEQADGAVFGEVSAAARIAQIHLQLAQQEIEDAEATFAKEDALRQQGLVDMVAAGKAETEAYKNAKKAEVDSEQAFQDQIRELQAKATAQQIADIIAVKNAYAGYISGTVGATLTGLSAMAAGTQNWRQVVIGIYSSITGALTQALQKMVTKWVVEHVFMTATQRAQLALQNAQQAASEAAKTGTTAAGATARAGVENTGFFAKILSLLGISVGAHTGAETAKTTATVTGAATRAAAEDTAAATATAAQMATNLTLALSYAGVAGAAGTASFAAAPWPIDLGAPAFGAAMYADALSYASLASLDTGTNELPRDMVVRAHEGERVVPKADNRKLIEILRVATDATRHHIPPSANQGGDAHLHLHSVIPPKPREMRTWFLDNHQFVGGAVKKYVRQLGDTTI